MVIGETFAWAHLPKTGGDATLLLFRLVPELIVFADDAGTNAKHDPFSVREKEIEGKRRIANLRRLPSWMLSHAMHESRYWRYPDGSPFPLPTPDEIAHRTLADKKLSILTTTGRFNVDRWLRMEFLREDFLELVSELIDVTEERKQQILAAPLANVTAYDHDVSNWFSPEQIERMYKNNPVWASIEKELYGSELGYREGKNLRLQSTERTGGPTYTLVAANDEGEDKIVAPDGTSIPVVPHALHGHLGDAIVARDFVEVVGWAADIKRFELPTAILIFANGEFRYAGRPNLARPDVAAYLDNAALQEAGFYYTFPLQLGEGGDNPEIRVFAVSKERVASELTYPAGYRWGRKSAVTPSIGGVTYTLIAANNEGQEKIIASDGASIPVIPGALRGQVDAVSLAGDFVEVRGWAADVTKIDLPTAIVIFANGKSRFSGRTDMARPDVADYFGNAALRGAGFSYALPRQWVEGGDNVEIRVFAVSREGVASELTYPTGYRWRGETG